MTRSDHVSGTDRVAEVAKADSAELIVNVQGDEPFIESDTVDAAILSLLGDPAIMMGTLKKCIASPAEASDSHVVKVVTDLQGRAIYFSRYPIPYHREIYSCSPDAPPCFKHIGLYVYRIELLLSYPDLPIGPSNALRVSSSFERSRTDTPSN
jgi:3-deoxy-manno-octulosonate cytidylyltransferase (CMP-KDO synthetase)